MTSREELLQSIHPAMNLNKTFFLKVYGYEICYPGYADIAGKMLEDAGCSKAWEYYNSIVNEYEKRYQKQIKEVGKWYLGECEKEWKNKRKGSVEQRKNQQKTRHQSRRENWTKMSEILNFQPTIKVQ